MGFDLPLHRQHIGSTSHLATLSSPGQKAARSRSPRGASRASRRGSDMSAGVRDQAMDRRPGKQGLERLTPRELEILELISAGKSNTAIADQLSVMERTIESHIARIFTKLGLSPGPDANRRVLAVLAYLHGMEL
jgi:DNA-binding NarL/FixJ family response regulator